MNNTIQNDQEALAEILLQSHEIAVDFLTSLESPSEIIPSVTAFPDEALPEQGKGTAETLNYFSKNVLPSMPRMTGPRFWGYVAGGSTPASLAGDWLTSVLDENVAGSSWASSITQLSEQTLRFLLELLELPADKFSGTFTTGTTASHLLGLVTAREWCGKNAGVDITQHGIAALPGIKLFATCPHVSIIKMMGTTGLGRNACEFIPHLLNKEAMDVDALDDRLKKTSAVGKIVMATIGTTTTGGFDDINAIADICQKHQAWLHVDGAFGAFARCVQKKAYLAEGLERADSISIDCHKWLNIPYDSGLFFTKHVQLLEHAHGITASYLNMPEDLPCYMNRSIEISQRFRALPIWMMLHAYGRSGVAGMIENSCLLADKLGHWIEDSKEYRLLTTINLNVVFWNRISHEQSKEKTQSLIDKINSTGIAFCSCGEFDGNHGIRAAFCNWRTQEKDIDAFIGLLKELA